jgi:hypothetical protein
MALMADLMDAVGLGKLEQRTGGRQMAAAPPFSPPKQHFFAGKWEQTGHTATAAKARQPFKSNHPINHRTRRSGKFPVTRLQGTQRPEMRQEKRRVKGAKGGNYL